jgi:hypothetical protein
VGVEPILALAEKSAPDLTRIKPSMNGKVAALAK